MIEGAFTFPTNRDDWLKTVLIGGILVFLAVLIVPLFIVYGYLVRVVRETIAGTDDPPVFEEWGDLLVEGVQTWVIGVVYMIVPLVVGAVLVGGSVATMLSGGRAGAGLGAAGLFGGIAVTGVLGLVFGYLAVAGIVQFARAERFGAAFDVDGVRTLATDADFAVAWIVSLVGFLVAGVIAWIPLVGWVASPFAYFYASVVAGRLWGGGYRDATDGPSDRASDQTAEETSAL